MIWHKLIVCGAIALGSVVAASACVASGEEDERATSEERQRLPGGEPCGEVICDAGERCCNASCGICVGPGGSCTDQICGPAR